MNRLRGLGEGVGLPGWSLTTRVKVMKVALYRMDTIRRYCETALLLKVPHYRMLLPNLRDEAWDRFDALQEAVPARGPPAYREKALEAGKHSAKQASTK